MAKDPLKNLRKEVELRLAAIRDAGPRVSPLDLYARMDAIRQLAAAHGLAALEDLAHSTAQRALLPGHRITMQSCFEHIGDAFDSHSDNDRAAILAAVAVRLH
jgi:hypothetical protein